MDDRNHQTFRHGAGLRSSAPQMGRRTYFRMARSLSQAGKGFRSDNRQRRCLGVRCAHPNPHAATRKSLKSNAIIMSQTLRETDEQPAAFAMQIKDKYKFSSDSTDRYQTVKDWLLRYLSITRGLERNAEGEGKVSGGEKSTDPGLSAAERKTLRSREAEEAIAEHESAQKAFHENRERLRREEAAGPMLYPAPELPGDTSV